MEMRKGYTGHYKLRDHAHPKNRDYWPTPKGRDYKGQSQRGIHAPGDALPNAVAARRSWLTPKRPSGGGQAVRKTPGGGLRELEDQICCAAETKLNPEWVEWLMSWPIGWTSLEPMPRTHFRAWLDAVRDGSYWDADPADCPESGIKRTTPPGIPHWAARLTAIGNGQVPACAATAWQALRGERGTDANKT